MSVKTIYLPIVDIERGRFAYESKSKALAAGRRMLKKELEKRPYLDKYEEHELLYIDEIRVKA